MKLGAVAVATTAAALLVSTTSGGRLLSSSSTGSTNDVLPPPVVTCDQFGLRSVFVRGAPNAFCSFDEPCTGGNTWGGCPPSNSYDITGAVLPSGSCCALLENTGAVGCVRMELIGNGFQCLVSGSDSPSPSPSDTGASSAPTQSVPTTQPSPTSTSPTPTTAGPVSTTVPSSSAPKTPAPRPSSSSPTSSSSTSSSSSSSSSSSDLDPDAGDQPVPTRPRRPTPAPTTLAPTPTTTGTLPDLDPIIEFPSPSSPSSDTPNVPVSANSDGNTTDDVASSSSSSTAALSLAFSTNMALFIVLGSVATLALVIGIFSLRRRRDQGSSSHAKSSSLSTLPPLTPFDDAEFDDRRTTLVEGGFSPIHVQQQPPSSSTHAYMATSTPSHDRPSYFI